MSKEKILTIDDLPMHKDTYFFGYGINIDKPYEMANQIIKLKKENQELKKQLEVGKEQYNDLVEEKEKIQEQLSSNTLQFENQQKEFIELLEEKIPRSSYIGEDGFGRIQYESKDIYYEINKILLKYKEIVGGKEWDKD